jgi:hypothetical protein
MAPALSTPWGHGVPGEFVLQPGTAHSFSLCAVPAYLKDLSNSAHCYASLPSYACIGARADMASLLTVAKSDIYGAFLPQISQAINTKRGHYVYET